MPSDTSQCIIINVMDQSSIMLCGVVRLWAIFMILSSDDINVRDDCCADYN